MQDGGNRMQERDERLPADVAIRIFHGDQSLRAQVANVSLGGARLNGVGELPEGAPVTLLYLHLCLRARVAWSDGQDVGVQFQEPLDPGEIVVLKDVAIFALSRVTRSPGDSTPD